jgi:hypothetical protein
MRSRLLIGLGIWAVLFGGVPGGVQAQAGKPKVMVVIEEKVAGVFGTTGWETVGQAESTLAARFMAAGFPVVDPQTVHRNIPRDKAMRLLAGDERAAAVAGLQFGAQILIMGTAISKNAGGKLLGTSMQSLQATVQARAVRSDDARIIATHTAQEAQAHIDEVQGGVMAIQRASETVADALIASISGQDASAGGRQQITLVISGLVSYRHLMAVRSYLEGGLKGVQGVQQHQFAQGTAELSLGYAGTAQRIADQLALEKFTGFRLEPINVSPNRVDLQAVLDK